MGKRLASGYCIQKHPRDQAQEANKLVRVSADAAFVSGIFTPALPQLNVVALGPS
jgi:hypothetical protein